MARMIGWKTLAGVALVAAGGNPLSAQRVDALERALEGVVVIERYGAQLPLDAQFVADSGESVKLGTYFVPGKPVLLSFNYSSCPQNCNLQLSDIAATFPRLNMIPGRDFEAISISIDPEESVARARATKERYSRESGVVEASQGWHFLTGTQESISRVAQATGYGYKRDEQSGVYIHKSALIVLTPGGVVSGYDHGPPYLEAALTAALVKAARGEVGPAAGDTTSFDEGGGFLNCFVWNPGSNAGKALMAMQIAGIAVVLGLVVFIVLQRRSTFRRSALLKHKTMAAASKGQT